MNDQLKIAFDSTDGLTREEMSIWNYLQRNKGRDNVVTGDDLSEQTGISYYRIRQAISHLVNNHGRLIASNPKGYYVPQTASEVEEATRSLRHRGISILARAAKLQKISIEDIFHQARLEYKEDLVTVEL